MFRLWARTFQDGHMLRDTVVADDRPDTRTHKVYHALDEVCARMDLSHPIWLEVNKQDFLRTSKTRFTSDSFTEPIPFDYLEIWIIEEDLPS